MATPVIVTRKTRESEIERHRFPFTENDLPGFDGRSDLPGFAANIV